MKRVTSAAKSAGTNVAALSEAYVYNDYGQVSSRSVSGAVSHPYSYSYKSNAAKDLDYISLPNALRSYPQTDVYGRNEGKILKNASGEQQFGEYVYYKKVGDHATNQVSSIRYGGLKSGKYTIGDGLKYSYDKNGNISEIRENGLLVAKYTYDKIDRLIREDNKKQNKSIFFTYDNNGNILSKREAAYSISVKHDEITTYTAERLYTYDGTHSDRLVDIRSGDFVIQSESEGSQTITYNNLGNPLTYRGNAIEWQNGRQLKKYGNVVSEYDGYGKRTKKTVIQSESEGSQTVYTYDISNKLIKQSDGTNTLEFIYDNSGLSGIKHNSIDYIIRKNVQGDITHILDLSGNIVVQYAYDAWGNHVVTCYNSNGAVIQSDSEESQSHIGNLNPFRYRSYYYDTETKLYFLQTRYYDPEIGRFISQDDVSYLDPETINGLNLYTYCGNNPVMRVDPNGNAWWDILAWIGVGLVAAAIIVVTAGMAGAVIGGIAGGIIYGAAIGTLAVGVVGAALGAVGGIVYDAIKGNDFGTSIWTGVKIGFGIGAIAGAIIGGAIGGAASASVAGMTNTSFWTGLGTNGATTAANAAAQHGLTTIGQTFGGKVVGWLTNKFGYAATKYLWISLSKTMASTVAMKTVIVFTTGATISTTSVFWVHEVPRLIERGIDILQIFLGG